MDSPRQKILLVDDEDLVREITAMTLEDFGFEVLGAESGKEALTLFEANPDVAAAILDFSMPQMTGYELSLELRKRNPGIGILMISGLAITAEVSKMQQEGGLVFISKPFENQLLIKSLQKVLLWSTQKT